MTPSPSSGRVALASQGRAAGAGADADASAPGREADRRVPALPGAGALAVALLGLALGLAATAIAVGRGWTPGAVAVGPWVATPRIGTAGIDPYARAALARSGTVPMAANEGLSFTATTDDTGYRLLRTCSYRLGGTVPPTRFWTLAAAGPDGSIADDAVHLSAFTSTSVLRDTAGRFTIDLGPEARPNNWLPLSGEGFLTLTLRLYDTPLTGDPAEIATAALPTIARQGCGAAGR